MDKIIKNQLTLKKLDNFVKTLNLWGEAYNVDYKIEDSTIKFIIRNLTKAQRIYNNLLKFCASNNILVKSTDVCTYTTVLRIEEK